MIIAKCAIATTRKKSALYPKISLKNLEQMKNKKICPIVDPLNMRLNIDFKDIIGYASNFYIERNILYCIARINLPALPNCRLVYFGERLIKDNSISLAGLSMYIYDPNKDESSDALWVFGNKLKNPITILYED